MNSLNTTSILVSGGSSFVGKQLVKHLQKHTNSQIIVCSRSDLSLLSTHENTVYEKVDLLDNDSYREVFLKHNPKIVFHLAAITRLSPGENDPELTIRTNFFGTKIIADLCVEFKSNIFISISSNLARNPKSVVGLTKYFSEVYLRNKANQTTKMLSIRLANVLDSPGSVTPLFKKLIDNNKPITITHPEMERRFIDKFEASELITQMLTIADNSNVYVVMKDNTRIVDLAKDMLNKFHKKLDIEFIGMKKGEKLIEEAYKESEIIRTKVDELAILKDCWSVDEINDNIITLENKSNKEIFLGLMEKLKLNLQL